MSSSLYDIIGSYNWWYPLPTAPLNCVRVGLLLPMVKMWSIAIPGYGSIKTICLIPSWYAFLAHSSQGLAVVNNFPPSIPELPYFANCKKAFYSACKDLVWTWLPFSSSLFLISLKQ